MIMVEKENVVYKIEADKLKEYEGKGFKKLVVKEAEKPAKPGNKPGDKPANQDDEAEKEVTEEVTKEK